MTPARRKPTGVVLIVVLWVVAVLAVVCLALGGAVRFQQAHLRRNRDELTSQQALLSAVALGKNLLLGDGRAAETLADEWTGEEPEQFVLDLGRSTVLLSGRPGRWGLEDESGRLNANVCSAEMLAKLPGMTPAAAEAFVSARESARAAAPGEALLSAPGGLTGPYATPAQLAEALEEAFAGTGGPAPMAGQAASEMGLSPAGSWAAQAGVSAAVAEVFSYLTIYSRQRNVDDQARPRTNINTAAKEGISEAVGGHFTDEQIEAIVASRAERPFGSVGELLTRTMEIHKPDGAKVIVRIGREQLKPVVDRLTTTDAEILLGLVNVNTACEQVLRCLPGLSEADASGIAARRAALEGQDGQALANPGWLLDVLSDEAFARVCPFVTTRSQQFRLRAEARPARAASEPLTETPGWAQPVTRALGVLERDAKRCNVLVWLVWAAPRGVGGA